MKRVLITIFLASMGRENVLAQQDWPSGVTRTVLPNGVVRFNRVSSSEPGYWWQLLLQYFSLKPAKSVPFRRSIAFLAGVSKYDFLSPGRLPFVETDVTEFRNFLLSDGGFDVVLEARDSIVTRDLIDDYMGNEFAANGQMLTSEDRLLFYFSGHGIDQAGAIGYLQFSRAKENQFGGNYTLKVRDFQEWSKVIVAKHLLVILDSCASGLAITPKTGGSEGLVKSLSGEGSGRILTAGYGREKVYGVDGARGYSIFTRALIDSLQNAGKDSGRAGLLTIDQAYGRIQTEAANFNNSNMAQGKKMSPQLGELPRGGRYSTDGTFVFLNKNFQGSSLPSRYSSLLEPVGKGRGTATKLSHTRSSPRPISLLPALKAAEPINYKYPNGNRIRAPLVRAESAKPLSYTPPTRLPSESRYTAVALNGPENILAALSEKGQIELWDYRQLKLKNTMGYGLGRTSHLTFCGSGDLCTLDGLSFSRWNIQSRQAESTKALPSIQHPPGDLGFRNLEPSDGLSSCLSARGEWAIFVENAAYSAVNSSHIGDEVTSTGITFWNVADDRVKYASDSIVSQAKHFVTEMDCGDQLAIIGEEEGGITLWDPLKALLLKRFRKDTHDIMGIKLSPNERLVAASSTDGRVSVWNLNDTTKIQLGFDSGRWYGVSTLIQGPIEGSFIGIDYEMRNIKLFGPGSRSPRLLHERLPIPKTNGLLMGSPDGSTFALLVDGSIYVSSLLTR